MIKNIIISAFVFATVSAMAEKIEINGFIINCSDGCQVTLSLDGDIQSITLPAGIIKFDSSDKVRSAGGAEIKRDSSGMIRSIGSSVIKRDNDGEIKSVGGVVIKKDDDGKILSVGGSVVRREDDGRITGVDESESSVRAVFKVTADA